MYVCRYVCMCVCVYVYVCVCVYVCMYVCIHLSIYLSIYVCIYVWMYGWMEGRTDGWMCGCMDVWLCGYVDMGICGYGDMWMCGCMDVSMCACLDVWMYAGMDGWTDWRMGAWMDVWRLVLFISTWILYIERESYLGDRIATDDMCSFTLSLLSVDTVAGNCDLNLNYWVACVCPWKDGKIGEVRLSQSQTTSAWTILPTSTRDHIHIENTQGKVLISCSMTKGFILKQAGWKQETKQQSQLISINQLWYIYILYI